jgi:outer membrane protein assembly factor BamE
MRFALLLASCLVLAACGPFVHRIDVQQGNYVTQDSVAKLKKGMTKAEVRQLLGTPLLSDVFHANRWDYYFSHRKGRSQSEERKRFTVLFQDEKVVDFSGEAQPADSAPAGPTTPPPGR